MQRKISRNTPASEVHKILNSCTIAEIESEVNALIQDQAAERGTRKELLTRQNDLIKELVSVNTRISEIKDIKKKKRSKQEKQELRNLLKSQKGVVKEQEEINLSMSPLLLNLRNYEALIKEASQLEADRKQEALLAAKSQAKQEEIIEAVAVIHEPRQISIVEAHEAALTRLLQRISNSTPNNQSDNQLLIAGRCLANAFKNVKSSYSIDVLNSAHNILCDNTAENVAKFHTLMSKNTDGKRSFELTFTGVSFLFLGAAMVAGAVAISIFCFDVVAVAALAALGTFYMGLGIAALIHDRAHGREKIMDNFKQAANAQRFGLFAANDGASKTEALVDHLAAPLMLTAK